MKGFTWFKAWCEFLEGCSQPPPPGAEWLAAGWVRGLWEGDGSCVRRAGAATRWQGRATYSMSHVLVDASPSPAS